MILSSLPSYADILDTRIGKHEDFTRIVIDATNITDYHIFTLHSPPRLVIDFPELYWSQQRKNDFSKFSIINNIRFGRFREGLTRMVIDMNNHFSLEKFFIIPASDSKPMRLVFDIIEAPKTVQYNKKSTNWNSILQVQQQQAQQKRQDIVKQHDTNNNDQAGEKAPPLIVIIDPGHGGIDPGATHKHNGHHIHEKNITLELAKAVQKLVNAQDNVKILLTRDDDFFVPLRERFRIAEELNASLFISLHADSINNKALRGASIYTLSEEASDKESATLAKQENLSDIYAGQVAISDDEIVQSILLDLTQRNTMQESSYFANYLLQNLKKNNTILLNKPRRYAGFAVLKSPVIPSILIEAGFLSNKKDAALLGDVAFQERFAKSILEALNAYIKRLKTIKKS